MDGSPTIHSELQNSWSMRPCCRTASQNGRTMAIRSQMKMSRRRSFTPVSIALVLSVALAIASMQAARTAPKQPNIDGRAAPLLKVGNLSFKDLNRNGVLDPYEDWRLPVDRRVADLLS